MPQIQDFLSKSLQTGNIDNNLIAQGLQNLQQGNAAAQRDITRQVTGSMPMGSSAAVSALTKGLSDQQLGSTQQMLNFLMGQGQQGFQNKMGAFGGMMGLPSYIGAPSSIENAMLQTTQPYNLANLNAQQNWMSQMLGGTQGSYYTPEMISQPSLFSQVFSPLASGVMAGLSGGLFHRGGRVMHKGGIVKSDRELIAEVVRELLTARN